MDNATAIEKAIERFYLSGDNEAHTWLLQIQASKEAWNFIWDLLDSSKVHFYAKKSSKFLDLLLLAMKEKIKIFKKL